MKVIKYLVVVACLIFFVLFSRRVIMSFDFLKKMFSPSHKKAQFKPLDKSFFKHQKDKVVFYKLKNGLEVVILPDTREQRVFMQVAYRVGSANEDSKTRGMAHLLEHMIFKGTEEMSEPDLSKIAFKFGAHLNAYTDYDYTVYFFDTDNANYRPFLDILADCMVNATIDGQCLASELKAVVQELNMYRDDVWEELFNLMAKNLLPANHPYANPVIGYVQELAALKAGVLKEFYKKFYHPANATLFVMGNVNAETLKDEIEQKFGPIESAGDRAEPMFPPIIKEPKIFQGTILHNVATPCVKMLWITPGLEDVKSFACRRLLALALLSGKSGRLYNSLIEKEKVATFVKVDDPDTIIRTYNKAGFFEVSIACEKRNIDRSIKLVCHELEQIGNVGITEQELERCKAQELTSFVNVFEHGYTTGFNTQAFLWKCFYFATGDINAFFDYPAILERITKEDIAEFVKQHISPIFYSKAVAMPIAKEQETFCKEYQEQLKLEEAKVLQAHQRTTMVDDPKKLFTVDDVTPINFAMPKPTFDKVLENGLRVIGLQRKGVPSVSCVLKSKYARAMTNVLDIQDQVRGSDNLRPGSKSTIICGLTSDLLLKNSIGFSKDQNCTIFDTLGARVQFRADQASIYVTSTNFVEAAEQFLHVCLKPEFKEQDLNLSKSIALDLVKSHKLSNKYMAYNLYYQKAFAGTDFSWSFDNAMEEINQCTVNDLKVCHEQFYAPENLVLTIVGDFTQDAVLALEHSIHSSSKKSSAKTFDQKVPMAQAVEAETIKHSTPTDQQFLLMIRPSNLPLESSEAILANLLTTLILSGMGSKIWNLREQTGLFYSAGGVFASQTALGGSFIGGSFDNIRAIVNPSNSLVLREKMVEMLKEAQEEVFGSEDLDGVKQSYLEGLLTLCSSNEKLANTIAKLAVLELGFDYFDNSWQIVSNVKQEDITKLCKTHCNVDSMTTLLVGG